LRQPENDVKAVWYDAKRLFDGQRKGSLKRPATLLKSQHTACQQAVGARKLHFQAASICARVQAA